MSNQTSQRLQSKRRLVPSDKRKRALFSCDRCKLRKTKCNRLQNNDLKYDNITPCLQCSKAGVSCTTSIPRKKRFYGPVKNIALHYKCLLALITGLFPDSDVYNIEELIDIGHKLKFEMPNIDDNINMDTPEKEEFGKVKVENENEQKDELTNKTNPDNNPDQKVKNEPNDGKNEDNLETSQSKVEGNSTTDPMMFKGDTSRPTIDKDLPELPPSVKLRSTNIDNERLIMDKFGHTHFIGNFGTASLLNGLCDIIIKRSFNQTNPPTSTQDIRDSSVQTITSENEPVYQYPTHLYNLDAINVDRFPLINIIERKEADVYVKIFFEHVHPYYFIFNQQCFMEKYELFWEELNIRSSKDKNHNMTRLCSAEICSIYTVWILGRRFQQYSYPEDIPEDSVLNSEMIGKFIDIIKLILSDIVLTPSIDGIRLLILFSVYLSSIKVRESGYCLMELAAIQAKSLGLHRKSIVNKFNDQKSDVMKRILWTLTKAESTLCCSFGRASAIPWEEIDIGFPELNDISDINYKFYYLESLKLCKIIFEILEYKKKTQRDPLSLISIQKALYFKNKLENFWDDLPENWQDYKSLPIKRYKPKLQIQYHYYFITLTLPMFLYIVNSQNYIVKNDDPFLSLFICGIKSSFKTAEIISYTDSKGFFNGTLYYDVFYCYNAIMVLTLTYILFKSNNVRKQIIDLNNLNEKYDINLEEILKSINLIRKLVMRNLDKIDGTMKRMSDIIETLLEDLGIIEQLVEKFNAPASHVKQIEDKGNSVTSSIPSGYRRLRLNLNTNKSQQQHDSNKRKRSKTPVLPSKIKTEVKIRNTGKLFSSAELERTHSDPIILNNELHDEKATDDSFSMIKSFTTENYNPQDHSLSTNQVSTGSLNDTNNISKLSNNKPDNLNNIDNIFNGLNAGEAMPYTPSNIGDINDVLNSMSLNTDLMDALFGTDLFNVDEHLL